MATEKLNFDTYDSGWTSGVIGDVDEAISAADAAVISTTTVDDVALMGLSPSAIVDGDTVTAIDVVVRVRSTGTGTDRLGVELLIGGVVQGSKQISANLTGSFQNITFSDAAWDSDFTEAQMDGMEIRLYSEQQGMAATAGHEVDCCDVDIVFTPAAGSVTLTADPGPLTLTGAIAALAIGLASTPGSLLLTGAEATLTATNNFSVTADPGSLVLTGAEADLIADQSFILTGDPGSLLLTGAVAELAPGIGGDPGSLLFTGAEADLIDSSPPLVVRRGGVRWLREPDPEKRHEKTKELTDLIKPAIKPKSASRAPQEPQETPIQTLAAAMPRLTAGQQTDVERLLEQTGISMDELLKLL